uniref:ribose-phosphate diphosphokinase n=2 Tax=Hemiselmis andersenii TaxID=464988 RepID=A0A6T8LT30_HEMAN|mmetsp:Transcript_30310/g.70794  ORF Transcript_30310/g.70794 Transcript_30310/m.70794 type:complete len:369 (+) Transcript_30310:61-1167(+)
MPRPTMSDTMKTLFMTQGPRPDPSAEEIEKNSATVDYEIYSGNSNRKLAEEVARRLGVKLSPATVSSFNDGECNIKVNDSVRNTHVYVLQSTCPGRGSPVRTINDHIMELYLLIRCFRRASARTVTAIIPYYGYSRQDEKRRPRVPIASSDFAMLMEAAGVDRILSVDLHSGQIQGQFQHCPVDNLSMFEDFAAFFVKHLLPTFPEGSEVAVVSPDADGTARAKFFLGLLIEKGVKNVSLAITIRQTTSSSIVLNLVGEVQHKECIIIDDIIDTGRRVVQSAEALYDLGALSVGAIATHGIFSGKAIAKIQASDMEYLVVSDSCPIEDKFRRTANKIVQVSCAGVIADAIHSINSGDTVSHLFAFGKE